MIYFNSTHLYFLFLILESGSNLHSKTSFSSIAPLYHLEFFNITTKWWFVVIRILVYQNNSP